MRQIITCIDFHVNEILFQMGKYFINSVGDRRRVNIHSRLVAAIFT